MVDLDDVLQGMIEQYVLCPTCHLPEWNRRNCNACGYSKTKADTAAATTTTTIQTFEIETDYGPVPEWERRLSEQMQHLYEIRSTQQSDEEQKRIDLLLNACWVADTPLLARKVTKVFEKHYAKVKV